MRNSAAESGADSIANQLINESVLEAQGARLTSNQENEMAKPELHAGETNKRPIPRCMLYKDGESKIFTGEDEIDDALEDGWEDEPVPANETAQAAPVAAFDHTAADRLAELNGLLEVATEAADELTADLAKAEESLVKTSEELEAQTKRADSAEKKLTAAEKKLAANANK